MMSLLFNINSNMHSQTGVWERGRSPVGCRLRLHRFNVCPFGFIGVVRGLHPTNFYEKHKHYNLTPFLSILFFNVKIQKKALGF